MPTVARLLLVRKPALSSQPASSLMPLHLTFLPSVPFLKLFLPPVLSLLPKAFPLQSPFCRCLILIL